MSKDTQYSCSDFEVSGIFTAGKVEFRSWWLDLNDFRRWKEGKGSGRRDVKVRGCRGERLLPSVLVRSKACFAWSGIQIMESVIFNLIAFLPNPTWLNHFVDLQLSENKHGLLFKKLIINVPLILNSCPMMRPYQAPYPISHSGSLAPTPQTATLTSSVAQTHPSTSPRASPIL